MENLPLHLSVFLLLLALSLLPLWIGSLARLLFRNANKKMLATITGFSLLAGELFLMRTREHEAFVCVKTGFFNGASGTENPDQMALWSAIIFFSIMIIVRFAVFYWMATGGILLVDRFKKTSARPQIESLDDQTKRTRGSREPQPRY